jgi:hypothetical protein
VGQPQALSNANVVNNLAGNETALLEDVDDLGEAMLANTENVTNRNASHAEGRCRRYYSIVLRDVSQHIVFDLLGRQWLSIRNRATVSSHETAGGAIDDRFGQVTFGGSIVLKSFVLKAVTVSHELSSSNCVLM